MTRVVDTREYLDVLRGLTEEGKEVSLLISGSSMSPFLIHARDYVYFRKPDRELKKGDIVFFQRDSGHTTLWATGRRRWKDRFAGIRSSA